MQLPCWQSLQHHRFLTLEGVSSITAFHPLIAASNHTRTSRCNPKLKKILPDSEIIRSHHNCAKFKTLILYAAFLVHGAARQALQHVWDVVSIEISPVTDNSLIFCNDDLPFWRQFSWSINCVGNGLLGHRISEQVHFRKTY